MKLEKVDDATYKLVTMQIRSTTFYKKQGINHSIELNFQLALLIQLKKQKHVVE